MKRNSLKNGTKVWVVVGSIELQKGKIVQNPFCGNYIKVEIDKTKRKYNYDIDFIAISKQEAIKKAARHYNSRILGNKKRIKDMQEIIQLLTAENEKFQNIRQKIKALK